MGPISGLLLKTICAQNDLNVINTINTAGLDAVIGAKGGTQSGVYMQLNFWCYALR
jgi:hypothetical protein